MTDEIFESIRAVYVTEINETQSELAEAIQTEGVLKKVAKESDAAWRQASIRRSSLEQKLERQRKTAEEHLEELAAKL